MEYKKFIYISTASTQALQSINNDYDFSGNIDLVTKMTSQVLENKQFWPFKSSQGKIEYSSLYDAKNSYLWFSIYTP